MNEYDDHHAFARSPEPSKYNPTKLHVGKLTRTIETSVTEAFEEWIIVQAHAQGIPKSEFIRELAFMAATGETYTFHVAKDKADAFKRQLAEIREKSGTRKDGAQ